MVDHKVSRSASGKNDDELVEAPWSHEHYDYHGDEVADPYRTLERCRDDPKSESAKAIHRWIASQNARTRRTLDESPSHGELRGEIESDWISTDDLGVNTGTDIREPYLIRSLKPSTFTSTKARFTMESQSSGSINIVMENRDGTERRVIFRSRDYERELSARFDWFFLNPRATFMICEAPEQGIGMLFDIEAGKVADIWSASQTIQFLAWHPFERGFYYRRPENGADGKEEPGIYYHALGVPWGRDALLLSERRIPRVIERYVDFWYLASSGSLALTERRVEKHKRVERAYLISPHSPRDLVETPPEHDGRSGKETYLSIANNELVLLLSNEGVSSRRRVVASARVEGGWSAYREIVGWLDVNHAHLARVREGLLTIIVSEDLGHTLKVFSMQGEELFAYRPPEPSTLSFYSHVASSGPIEISITNHRTPLSIYALELNPIGLREVWRCPAPGWVGEIEVTREFATSPDGTSVPLTIAKRKGVEVNGEAFTMLRGYGGYGICNTPAFDNFNAHWIKRGGILAWAHVRGDGGWVDGWQEAGSRRNKPNSFADYIACAERLIDSGTTCANRLVAVGGSNGGLTVLAAMLRRPDLFRCVVAQNPVCDMFNISMGMFRSGTTGDVLHRGCLTNRGDYQVIKAASPLQNVDPAKKYPPCLLMAGARDGVVHPAHSLKFVATMQDLCGADACHLYWMEDTGHCVFSGERDSDFDRAADMFQFILGAGA